MTVRRDWTDVGGRLTVNPFTSAPRFWVESTWDKLCRGKKFNPCIYCNICPTIIPTALSPNVVGVKRYRHE